VADQDESFSPAAEVLAKKATLIQSLQALSNRRKQSAENWKEKFKAEQHEREKAELENRQLRKKILDLEQRLAEFEQRAIIPRRRKLVESKASRSFHKSAAKRSHTDIVKAWVEGNFSDPEYGWGMVQGVLEQTYKDRATDGVLDAINRDLEKHMNREWCNAMKLRLGLSDDQWDCLAHSMFEDYIPENENWEPEEGKEDERRPSVWRRRVMPGSSSGKPYLRLPVHAALKTHLKKMCNETGLKATEDGEVAMNDFVIMLEQEVRKAVKSDGARFRDPDFVLEVQFLADALKCWRGVDITNFVFRLPQFAAVANSPRSVSLVGLWVGKDSYDNIARATAEVIQWMHKVQFKQRRHVVVDGRRIAVRLTAGGDLVFMRDALGITSRFCDKFCVCNFCEASKVDIEQSEITATTRTYERMCHLAHSFANDDEQEFTCPGCKRKFNRETQAAEEQPEEDDKYKKKHKYQLWHRPPPLPHRPHLVLCVHHAHDQDSSGLPVLPRGG
jgi:hypothetical protein